MSRSFLLIAVFAAGGPAMAVTCERIEHAGTPFTVCEVDPAEESLRLFLNDATGAPLGSFRRVEVTLDVDTLAFAMNAGMYHTDRRPVGHYVENGIETMGVVTGEGPGNFGLVPNGIFCIGDDTTRVYETDAFLSAAPDCRHATQSGPMLVIDGNLHPRFIPGSSSRLIRNGVGTSESGDRVVFAIAEGPVNFHDFATLFRDTLGLPQALYFDGNVSRLHAPQLGRSDGGAAMGPIVGVVD